MKRRKNLSDIFDLRSAIDRLKLEDLKEMGRSLLHFDDQMVVVLLPEDKEAQENKESSASLLETAK